MIGNLMVEGRYHHHMQPLEIFAMGALGAAAVTPFAKAIYDRLPCCSSGIPCSSGGSPCILVGLATASALYGAAVFEASFSMLIYTDNYPMSPSNALASLSLGGLMLPPLVEMTRALASRCGYPVTTATPIGVETGITEPLLADIITDRNTLTNDSIL